MKKVYSTDDEDYRYDNVGDLLDALAENGDLVEGSTYYEIDVEEVDLADYFNVDSILENAEEMLIDDIGEYAEGAFRATQSARTELFNFMQFWADKHLTKSYWKCKGKARAHRVCSIDVAKYKT